MFKDKVTYTDYNGVKQTEELRFNISQADVLEDISILDRAAAIEKLVQGDETFELTVPQKQQVLDLVKEFIKLAYGKQSLDGRHFRKSPEVWEDFRWSGAYDQYLTDLFQNPERAAMFGANVLPQDLRDRAEKAAREQGQLQADVNTALTELTVPPAGAPTQTEDDRPQWLKENRVPTDAELQGAPRELLMEAFRLKSQQQ